MTRPQFSRKEILYDLNNNNLPGQQLFNGSTWDNQYNNTQGTLLASAVRTANVVSANLTNFNARGIVLYCNITSASGTGGLTLYFNNYSPTGNGLVQTMLNTTPFTTTGIKSFIIYPGSFSGSGNAFTNSITMPIGKTFTISIVAGDTSSYTYDLGYQLIL